MKLENKLVIGALVLVGAIGLATNLGNRVEMTGCEIFQGWNHNKADGTVLYTFDEKDKWEREELGEKPNYRVEGDYAELEKGENRGKKYSLEIQGKKIGGKLISYQTCQ